MSALAKLILMIHIAAGLIVILTGITVLIIHKGGRRHRQLGWIYFWAMMGISISGVGLLLVDRFNLFLLLIAVLTFYISYTGVRSFRRVADRINLLDYCAAGAALLAGLLSTAHGTYNFIRLAVFSPNALLFFLFGVFLSFNAWSDLQWYKMPSIMTGQWRVRYHITRMGGSFIAAITAFALIAVQRMVDEWAYSWIIWLLPTILITPLISYYKRVYLSKRGM